MTNIYAHITASDAPKNQHITEVSFVDETGKNINFSTKLDDTGTALTDLRKLTNLDSTAGLADVITAVNAILTVVKAK